MIVTLILPCPPAAGQKGRAPADLEVVASRRAVEIDDFPGEVEVLPGFRPHRPGIELFQGDAAGGDESPVEAQKPRRSEGEAFEESGDPLPLLFRDAVEGTVDGDGGEAGKGGDQLPGEESRKKGGKGTSLSLCDVAEQAGVDFGGVEGRLEIDGESDVVVALQGFADATGQVHGDGTADAEGSELHLSEAAVGLFPSDEKGQSDVAEDQPVEFEDLAFGGADGNDGRSGRDDVDAQSAGPGKGVAAGTGPAVTAASRGDDDPSGFQLSPGCPDGDDPSALSQEFPDEVVRPDGDALPPRFVDEKVADGPCVARGGEDPFAPFDDGGQPPVGEKTADGLGAEGSQSGVEESPFPAEGVLKRLGRQAGIGEIASPLAGQEELFARLLVPFDEERPFPSGGRLGGGEKAGRAAADDDEVPVVLRVFFRFQGNQAPSVQARRKFPFSPLLCWKARSRGL